MDSGGSFQKAGLDPSTKLFFGQGLATSTGDKWALHRRIANQAFKMERVKVITPTLFSCETLFQIGFIYLFIFNESLEHAF